MPALWVRALVSHCLGAAVLGGQSWPWARHSAETADESPLEVSEVPIELGQPLLIQDLTSFSSRCFPASTPPDAKRIRVLASVVGLAGFPALSGGWTPARPVEPAADAGYETLAEEHERSADQFYVCVRTFSSQGCDALLTVLLFDAEGEVSPVRLRPSYPSIWPLGFKAANFETPAKLRFVVEAGFLEDVRITAMPVSGEVDVEVYQTPAAEGLEAKSGCSGVPIKVSKQISGPDIVDVLHTEQGSGALRHLLCVLVAGDGVVSVTVGPRVPGPFLTPAVASAGRFERGSLCERARLLVNDGTDITVTATAEDSSELAISASLDAEMLQASVANRWKGVVPPGGAGAALVVSGADVKAAVAESGAQGEAILSITVCRTPPSGPGGSITQVEATRFWMTAVTETSVVTLEDGQAVDTTVKAGGWRDFRFLFPGGSAKPKEVTISASSVSKVSLVVDTARHPSRWVSSGNSSSAVVRLTTEQSLASSEVHLIDCRMPCFVYVSGYASDEDDPQAESPLKVLASSDRPSIKPLTEGEEIEETLVGGETQVYRYLISHLDSAAQISVSRSTGGISFQVSASPSFPEEAGVTTTRAENVALLEPSSGPFQTAVAAAMQKGELPALYVRVKAIKGPPSSFSVSAKAQVSAKWLLNGAFTEGAVKASGYDRYRFFVSEAEASRGVDVSIEVTSLRGSVAVYASCFPSEYPRKESHDWGGPISGQGSVVISSSSLQFRAGWVYIGVCSDSWAAFSLRVRWGDDTVALQDGWEEMGNVNAGASRWYSFTVNDAPPAEQPVTLRAEALAGAVGLCVRQPPRSRRLGSGGASRAEGKREGFFSRVFSRRRDPVAPKGWKQDLGCKFAGVANASGGVEKSLAALDLLPESFGGGGVLELALVGLGSASSDASLSSEYALRALLGPTVILAEEHTVVVDSLGPPCCASSGAALRRVYRHFTRSSADSVDVILKPQGTGLLAGSKLLARSAGLLRDREEWPLVQEAPEEAADELRLHVDLGEITESQDVHNGFWLEVAVQVLTPLNFSLELQVDFVSSSGEVELVSTRLVPNVPTPGNLSQADTASYDFDVASSDEAVSLRVRKCYGQVETEVRHPDGHTQTFKEHEPGFEVVEDVLRSSASEGTSTGGQGSVLVRKHGQSAASYEVELATAHAADAPIVVPQPPVLTFSRRVQSCGSSAKTAADCDDGLVFHFDAASIGISSGWETEPVLRYLLVAVDSNDRDLHSNTTCGLLEAVKHRRAITGKWLQAQKSPHLEATLPLLHGKDRLANMSLMVNVLVTLAAPSETRQLAAASYNAFEFSKAMLAAGELAAEQKFSQKEDPRRGAYGVMLLGVASILWLAYKGKLQFTKGAREQKVTLEREPIEMETTCVMQEDSGRSSLLAERAQRSGYVPPSM